jgi:DNA-binding IclR family transcriptional regulator
MSPTQRDDTLRESGLDRAAAIPAAFDAAQRKLTLTALVARCGPPRSTTHRTALAGSLGRRTPRALTSKVAIMRELTAVPERGWAIDREEGNIGVSCVAAPIFGLSGDVAVSYRPQPAGAGRPHRAAVRLAAAAASRSYTSRPRAQSR